MSEPKRYSLVSFTSDGPGELREFPDGTFVTYEDYRRIAANNVGPFGRRWQTVPLPPTQEMIDAAEAVDLEMRQQGFNAAEPEAIYFAMLDVAPTSIALSDSDAIDCAIGVFLDDADWQRGGLGIDDKRRRMQAAINALTLKADSNG